MNTAFDNEIKLKLLKLLEDKPELTQREMNFKMGVSLGKINYCISTLVEKGMIRVERFKKSNKRTAYIYRLTPKGFEALANLTMEFLKLKIKEYDQIRMEIKRLTVQMDKINPDLYERSDLISEVKKRI